MALEGRVILRGGRLMDPAGGRNEEACIVCEGGRIAEITKEMPTVSYSDNVVDIRGCFVTPGLIDHHCHIYPLAETIGLPGEPVMFSGGVTTVVDAGSCGTAHYLRHRSYREQSMLDYKAYINVSAMGLTEPEDLRPERLDEGALKELFEVCGEEWMGLKIRVSRSIVKDLGFEPLRKTIRIAEKLGVPVMVHPTDPPGSMDELLSLLRPGDVCTHMYMNLGSTILDEEGRVRRSAWEARKRGVLFEAADAQAHFGFSTAIPAIEQGFLPDFIATDGTRKSMLKRPTTFNLAMQMAKYESLGIPFQEVLRLCTAAPAAHMGLKEGQGTISIGGKADLAVFRRHEKEVIFGDRPVLDPEQRTHTGHVVYEPVLTVKSGMVVYRNILL